jgi:transaldolase
VLPPADVLAEIDRLVDMQKLEDTLMSEGVKKFADPLKALLKLIAEKRKALHTSQVEAKGGKRQEVKRGL